MEEKIVRIEQCDKGEKTFILITELEYMKLMTHEERIKYIEALMESLKDQVGLITQRMKLEGWRIDGEVQS